jgi:hypothetical protein
MAYSEKAKVVSMVAAATLAATDVYCAAFLDTSGRVLRDPGTTATWPVGIILGRTVTTSSNHEAIPIGVEGVLPIRMGESSTLSLGNYVAASSNGYGVTPTTSLYILGVVVAGASGGTGRIMSFAWKPGPAAATP